jgi:hypothetical protein
MDMKPEYTEGPKATENFEQAMKAIFKAPKTPTKKGKQKDKPITSQNKTKSSDRD